MEKKEIKKLRSKGYSFSEISKKAGLCKSYCWRLSNKIPFRKKGKVRYYKKVKGIEKQIKLQKKQISIQKARIISHLFFDGSIFVSDYHWTIKYINSSIELIKQFKQDMYSVYGLKPSSFECEKGKYFPIYKVSFLSKKAYEDLICYSPSFSTSSRKTKIPSLIIKSPFPEIKLELIRAFFEDEGSITLDGRLMADSRSKSVLIQIQKILGEFGFEFKLIRYKEEKGWMYKLYSKKSLDNLKNAYNLKLFEKSIITRGINKGNKKIDILKKIIESLKKAENT